MKDASFTRFKVSGWLLLVIAVSIVLKTLNLQLDPKNEGFFEGFEKGKQLVTLPVQAERGNIYDRWGNLLAGNREVYELGVDIPTMRNSSAIASAVNKVLGLDYTKVYRQLEIDAGRNPDAPNATPTPQELANRIKYRRLAINVEPKLIDQLSKMEEASIDEGKNELSGIIWNSHLIRTYPEGSLAGTVLGFVTFMDSESPTGYQGIEGKYNDFLTGSANAVVFPRDPRKLDQITSVPPGASLILTIDRELQAAVERILDKAMKSNGASAGTVLVMDPKTGEILAMTSTPTFDPNTYDKNLDRLYGTTPLNRAIGQDYEPGSVFKVLTMAAALDAGTVTPQMIYEDKNGVFNYAGISVINWNRGAWGKQNMTECLKNSLNVCLAWVSTKLGPTKYYEYLQKFGIGRPTNIDLQGEISFPLTIPGDNGWHDANLATNAYGHAVSVTPIQMVMALSAVANDGKMMAPHVLKAVVDGNRQYDNEPQVAGTPIKAETARTLSAMLEEAIKGEASTSAVPGYAVAGKTGTADIPIKGNYNSGLTNASFAGWGPVDDPRFLIYVWFERPKSNIYGSIVAAPVFKEVFQTAVTLYNIPPDKARQQLYGH
jgi:cell division protein FtsI/penicillin-binding protein 2